MIIFIDNGTTKLNHMLSRTSLALLVGLLFITACDSTNFKSDGFKNIKFGMTTAQLTQVGFTCEPDKKVCQKRADSKAPTDDNATLFGKPADVEAQLKSDATAVISVRISIEDKEMIDLFSKALGKPKTFEYTGITGDKIRRYYWISSDNTSICVTTNLDEGPPQGIFKMIGPRSSAVYRGQAETKTFKDDITKNSVKPTDL